MFIIRWWRFFRGFVVISLEGRGVERLLNLAAARGISFWDMQKQKQRALLSLSLASFRALRPLVRMTHCRLRIRRKVGFPFIKYRLRRRWGLVVGAFLFIAAIYLATSVVWYVRVTGNSILEKTEVLTLAGDLGIRPGVWKGKLNLPELEEELPRRHSAIAWAGLRLSGILLEIEIVEHLPEVIPDDRPADLVASKDGLIVRIMVIEGKAAVKVGDTVSKDDLLIEGIMDLEEGILDPEEQLMGSEEVRARGIVEARVWYEICEPLRLEQISATPTGASCSSFYLRWQGGQRRLWGPSSSPYSFAREKVRTSSWRWRNLSFPVEVIKTTYLEQLVEYKSIPRDEAVQAARQKARKILQAQIPEGVLSERHYFQEYIESETEWIRAVAETKEDIGKIRLRGP